jgi:hypothetical protein
MRATGFIILSIITFAFTITATQGALCNGGKGKRIFYDGRIRMGKDSGDVFFSTELEKVLFRLNSVQNTYKVVRIRIDNRSKEALHLSRQKDTFEFYVDDRVIPGIIDFSTFDPTVWDAFDADMRKALVYPEVVEAKEEENVFIFIPKRDFKDVPQKFAYVINSLSDRHVMIEQFKKATAD